MHVLLWSKPAHYTDPLFPLSSEDLVAYSDDDDDEVGDAGSSKGATAAGAEGVKAVNGSSDGVKDGIRPDDEGRGATRSAALDKSFSSSRPGADSVLHLLPPLPTTSSRLEADPPDGSTASSSKDPDPYWGLSSSEKAMTDPDDPLYQKLANFHKLKEEQGTHFNQSLNRNRSFRNPHIYSKLVQWVEVEETGSAYCDMVKEEKEDEKDDSTPGRRRGNADAIWASSARARAELKRQGGKDVIAALQRKRQEEADERKKRARRENIDFVASTSSPSRQTTGTVGARGGEGGSSGDRERERHRERERDRDRDRHQHRHHRERR